MTLFSIMPGGFTHLSRRFIKFRRGSAKVIETKDNDIKEEYFYNRVPTGGKILSFGTVNLMMPPGEGLTGRQISDLRFAMKPEEVINQRASNWRRW